jgi:hypothetical protein
MAGQLNLPQRGAPPKAGDLGVCPACTKMNFLERGADGHLAMRILDEDMLARLSERTAADLLWIQWRIGYMKRRRDKNR